MTISLIGCSGRGDFKKESETKTTSEGTTTSAEDTDSADETEAAKNTEDDLSTVGEVYPEDKLMIGVEIYDPTDSEFLTLQNYFNYISENMNIEFKFSEAITDADQEMKFIEDCAIAGCKGFLVYYNITRAEQVNKVIEYDMYF